LVVWLLERDIEHFLIKSNMYIIKAQISAMAADAACPLRVHNQVGEVCTGTFMENRDYFSN
jgi:hypothetical protein